MLRRRRGGAAPLLLILLVMVALALALFYFARGREIQRPGIQAMAGMAPADTRFFAAADLEGGLEPAEAAGEFKAWLKELPERGTRLEELERGLGVPLEKLAAWFRPVGFAAVFPAGQGAPAGKPVEALLALRVADPEALQKYLEERTQRLGTAEEKVLAGSTFRFFGQGRNRWGYGFHEGFLVMGSGEGALDRLSGEGDRLAGDPLFQGARKQARADKGFFVYVPIAASLEPLWRNPAVAEKTDEETRQGLGSLLYFAAAGDLSPRSPPASVECFLRVDPAGGPWAEALLGESEISGAGARFVPLEWSNYTALNLHYLVDLLMKTAELSPESRARVGMLPALFTLGTGTTLDDLWKASSGELGFSTDLLINAAPVFSSNYQKARGRGQLVACQSNLKNLGTALEMYCTDHSGRYPRQLGLVTPNYLKTIPTCPSAGQDTYSQRFQSAAFPDLYTVVCSGKNHPELAGPDLPAYTSVQGLQGAETAAAPEQPRATLLVVLSLKDVEKARAILERLARKAGGQALVAATAEGVKIYGVTGAPRVHFFLAEQPSPALVVAGGPDSLEQLEKVVALSRDKAASMAASPLFQEALKEAGVPRTVMVDAMDLEKTREELAASIPQLSPVLKAYPRLEGSSFVRVEADGIRWKSRGVASSSVLFGGGIAAAIAVPNFIRARGQGQLTACKSNLKNLGTALEMYSTDFKGRYPRQLVDLTPNYLRTIPTCPDAGVDTYRSSFRSAAGPDRYTVICEGQYHTEEGLPANYPQYTAVQGIRER